MKQEEEFVDLIRSNERLIAKVSSFYSAEIDEQADLRQEIILQLWKSYGRFRGESSKTTWMYRVAMNTAISFLRKKKSRPSMVSIKAEHGASSIDGLLHDQLAELRRQVNLLDDLEKGIMLLLLEEKSYDEISEITGLSKSNVGTRISRIKKKIRTQMQRTF